MKKNKQPIFVDVDGKEYHEGDEIILDPTTSYFSKMKLHSKAENNYYNLIDDKGVIHWVNEYRLKNQNKNNKNK